MVAMAVSRTNNYELLAQEVISRFSEIAPDVTISSQLCPACGGGTTRERSFNVTRVASDGSLRWMCHRASCDFKGTSNAGGYPVQETARLSRGPSAAKAVRSVADRVGPLVDLPIIESLELNLRYNLREPIIKDCGLRWSTAVSPKGSGRVFIPLRSAVHASNGCVLRAIDGKQQPKALTFKEPEADTTLGWFDGGLDYPYLFIVEDAFSAMRCAQEGFLSVTLSGTNLSDERLAEIRSAQIGKGFTPLLCLDADAFPSAIVKMRQVRLRLKNPQVIKLEKDIKNMSLLESSKFFEVYKKF